MKDHIVGLVDRQGPPNREWAARGIKAFVVKVKWADLQPEPFGPLQTDLIDSYVAGCNSQSPTTPLSGCVFKLRVFAGVDSPAWVRRIAGWVPWRSPKDAVSTVDGGSVPRWWDDAFTYAYEDLQRRLAAKYDHVDCVRSVAISGPSTLYDEAMARQFSDSPDNLHAAMLAGYTYERDLQAIFSSIYIHAEAWPNTPSSVAVQPVSWGAFGSMVGEEPSYFWRSLTQTPGNIVIGNHSLATPKIRNTEWQDFYAWLKEVPSLGAPYPARGTYIQTEAMNRIGDVQDVMRYARSLGVRYVELPKGYMAWDKSWFGDWLPES